MAEIYSDGSCKVTITKKAQLLSRRTKQKKHDLIEIKPKEKFEEEKKEHIKKKKINPNDFVVKESHNKQIIFNLLYIGYIAAFPESLNTIKNDWIEFQKTKSLDESLDKLFFKKKYGRTSSNDHKIEHLIYEVIANSFVIEKNGSDIENKLRIADFNFMSFNMFYKYQRWFMQLEDSVNKLNKQYDKTLENRTEQDSGIFDIDQEIYSKPSIALNTKDFFNLNFLKENYKDFMTIYFNHLNAKKQKKTFNALEDMMNKIYLKLIQFEETLDLEENATLNASTTLLSNYLRQFNRSTDFNLIMDYVYSINRSSQYVETMDQMIGYGKIVAELKEIHKDIKRLISIGYDEHEISVSTVFEAFADHTSKYKIVLIDINRYFPKDLFGGRIVTL
jgi:hypothetical protein